VRIRDGNSHVIAFEDVSHAYQHVTAVDGVSLRVDAGETVALIGPSGCGKSTLLKLAVGLVWPRQGRVFVNGEELQPGNALQVRQRIGYVIQSGGLFPHMSALDNVTLAARYLRRARDWTQTRVAELAELVQLPLDVLGRFPGDLSGGQRQRVSLMRALMLDPAVLLLDEPLGALDPIVRHGLQEDLRKLFARLRKSVLLVTHDMAEAAFFSRHLVLMRDGRIVQQGTYRELATTPSQEFVREFVEAQRGLHRESDDA
jgi:osmoprotectant transport system ATP-binding protein